MWRCLETLSTPEVGDEKVKVQANVFLSMIDHRLDVYMICFAVTISELDSLKGFYSSESVAAHLVCQGRATYPQDVWPWD